MQPLRAENSCFHEDDDDGDETNEFKSIPSMYRISAAADAAIEKG